MTSRKEVEGEQLTGQQRYPLRCLLVLSWRQGDSNTGRVLLQ